MVKVNASLSQEWHEVAITCQGALEIALDLAIQLQGTPVQYCLFEDIGAVIFADVIERSNVHPFICEPNASNLAAAFWRALHLDKYNERLLPAATLRIPNHPLLSGIGSWSELQLTMWEAKIICLIEVVKE